jgi:hypothetical protein
MTPASTPTLTQAPESVIQPTNPPPVATAIPTTSSKIALVIQKVGYDRWGRPKSMDDPHAATCGPFDDTHPMLRLLISIAATNDTDRDWPPDTEEVEFVKTNGASAYYCFYDYLNGGSYPVIHPGETYQITLSAFMERDERVDTLLFGIKDMGYTSAKIPAGLPVP